MGETKGDVCEGAKTAMGGGIAGVWEIYEGLCSETLISRNQGP